MKRIIILGGMGPQASLELHKRIIERAVNNGARNGNDFPAIVHFSIPVVDFISDQHTQQEALKTIIQTLNDFVFIENDIIVLACNTAHLIKDEIESALHINLTSLISLTVEYVTRRFEVVKLYGSPTTVQSGLYSTLLEKRGVKVIIPSRQELEEIESVIRLIIVGKSVPRLKGSHEVLLLGCTELSCAYGNSKNTIDPLNIFIDAIMPLKEML